MKSNPLKFYLIATLFISSFYVGNADAFRKVNKKTDRTTKFKMVDFQKLNRFDLSNARAEELPTIKNPETPPENDGPPETWVGCQNWCEDQCADIYDDAINWDECWNACVDFQNCGQYPTY